MKSLQFLLINLILFCVFFVASETVWAGCFVGCPPVSGDICASLNDCNPATEDCRPSANGCCAVCIPKPCAPSCPSCGGGGSDGCGGTCGCNECGPHGAKTCGNWTQTYDCSGDVKGCKECGPDISAWTPACGNQTRTCTEDCGTDDCTGVATTRCNECGPVYGVWSACNASHQRSRTVDYDCQADTIETEDCIGTIQGSLFDASDYTNCASILAADKYTNQTFGLTGPWGVISTPVSTDATGNYSESVYVPGTYTYDYSALIASGKAAGIKFECQSAAASLSTQGQVFPKDTGFWRLYGGWWQAVGGSVHAENGITSNIPSSLLTEMSLILPDTSPSTRRGVLTYGTDIVNKLGTNPNAKVSTSLWQALSNYEGQVYDWSFFDRRFNLFAKTEWDGGIVSYTNPDPAGYQIFRTVASVNSFNFNPTGTQKAIFLVKGNVNVTGNVVVPDGAFLAIIASGTITFGTNVTQADGWYVGGSISIPCIDTGAPGCDKTDAQFLGNGSFVSWGNISMTRDRGITNNTEPTEIFTYRRDLYTNAPTAMKIYSKVYKPFVP